LPILTIQRRQTEVGRIRIGQKVPTSNGKSTRPGKLDRFRFTSPSRALIDQVAALYGGEVAEWAPPTGAKQWEVITQATSLPVVVPPNSVSQWYETWTGGGCARRCDGQREMISDSPCMCSPEPAERECKPTTRISLMLADVPGIGVWRLETHGFYAATELPAVAELLATAGTYIPARLELEQRSAKRIKPGGGSETRHWMVPVLHVDAAPKVLLAGGGNGGGAPAVTAASVPAIEAADPNRLTVDKVLKAASACVSVEQVKRLWADASQDGVLTDEVKQALTARAAELGAAAKPVSAPPVEPVDPPMEGEVEPDADAVWAQIMSAAPAEWGTAGLQERFEAFVGKPVPDANGFELQRFLTAVKDGAVT
jgi:hypothetical protein